MTIKIDPLEYTHFKDTGCALHPACLECPLPVCIYDDPFAIQREMWAAKDAERVAAVVEAEKTMPRERAIQSAAEQFGITTRTMYRILGRSEGS